MANPQKEKGYTPIANEILDEVLKRKFTKRQDRILNIVWRFSYGFNKKDAYFPEMKTFAMYGIAPQVIGSELKQLETLGVIDVDWDNGVIKFNKDYEMWDVPYHKAFVDGIHKYVMRLNLRSSERKSMGWNNSRRGGGRKPSEYGRYEVIINDMLFGSQDIKKLYTAYLTTKHWQFIRKRKLASVDNCCEGCMDRDGIIIHHLHYQTLGRELDSDLLALCPSCHKKDHYKHLLSPVEAIGSQRDNQTRLIQSKPIASEKDNLEVMEKITYAPDEANDNVELQPQKASRKQVGLKASSAPANQIPDPDPQVEQQSTIDDSYGIITEHTADDWIEYLIHIMKKPEQKYAPIAVQELAQWLVSNNDLELIEQCYDEFCKVPLKKVFNRTGFFLKIISDVGGNTNFRQ